MAQYRAIPGPVRGGGVPSMSVPLDHPVGQFARWAFYAWMFSLPFEGIIPTWLPLSLQGALSIPRMVGIVLVLVFVFDPKTWPWRLPPGAAAFGLYFLAITLSMLRSNYSDILAVLAHIQLAGLLLISYNLFLSGRLVRGALFSYALSCGIAAAMILTGTGQDEYLSAHMGGRASGFGSDPNLYGKVLMVGVLVAIGIAHIRRDKGIVRLPLLWGIALITAFAIAQTGSRGTTLALAVGLATFVLRKGSFWGRLRNLGLLAAIAAVAFWLVSNTEVLKLRWEQTLATGTTAGRDMIFMRAIEMIEEKPIIGWGPGATRELAERTNTKQEERATHNMVLAMLTFNGILGSLPFFAAYATVFWMAFRARSGPENVLPLAIFTAIFMADMAAGGVFSKLQCTFFAYQLAAGQLASGTTIQQRNSGYVARSESRGGAAGL
jgi:O-antigen ligase